jgi:nucleoid DNA-binding protein
MRYIAKQIAERSSLNQMDVRSTIEGFLQIIPDVLIDGYIVDLGDFGNMWLQVKAGSSETAEDYHSSLIEGLKVNFRPGKLFKVVLNDAEFVKLSE